MPAISRGAVGILGAGYMGLATGLAFAERGCRVFAYDNNPRVRRALSSGHSPFHEDRLEETLRHAIHLRRFFPVASMRELVDHAEGIFLCLPTPSGPEGKIDLTALRAGAGSLGDTLRAVSGYRLVVVKSTVVPGTTESVVEPLLRKRSGKSRRELGVAVNPEFLAEGTMIRDALRPDRIVIGASDRRSAEWLKGLYARFPAPLYLLSPSGAELVKYASNAFLATKLSFANEIAALTERLDESVDNVMSAVGADGRIGGRYLRAGPGFGGSCLEKDLRALVARAHEWGVPFRTGESALATNEDQVSHSLRLIARATGGLRGRSVAVLGLSFKAGTDDVRESRAFPIVGGLLAHGAKVRVHDPVAMSNFRREWSRSRSRGARVPKFCASIPEALKGVDAAVIQAEWPVYADWAPAWTAAMRRPLVVDLRRLLLPGTARRAGLEVVALGVGQGPSHGPGPAPHRAAPRGRRRR